MNIELYCVYQIIYVKIIYIYIYIYIYTHTDQRRKKMCIIRSMFHLFHAHLDSAPLLLPVLYA
jgi:hypothetical protein